MTDDLLQKLTKRETEKAVKAAVTFVVDVLMSMSEEIKAVKAALLDFAEIFEKRKVRLHLGMISFRDLTRAKTSRCTVLTVKNSLGRQRHSKPRWVR